MQIRIWPARMAARHSSWPSRPLGMIGERLLGIKLLGHSQNWSILIYVNDAIARFDGSQYLLELA